MEFLVNNWMLIIVAVAAISVISFAIYKFVKTPSAAQIQKVKEWLVYAVAEAEKYLGSGTGELKLRHVYDAFINKFPYLVAVISFEDFNLYVEEALNKFNEMLQIEPIKNYIDK